MYNFFNQLDNFQKKKFYSFKIVIYKNDFKTEINFKIILELFWTKFVKKTFRLLIGVQR